MLHCEHIAFYTSIFGGYFETELSISQDIVTRFKVKWKSLLKMHRDIQWEYVGEHWFTFAEVMTKKRVGYSVVDRTWCVVVIVVLTDVAAATERRQR